MPVGQLRLDLVERGEHGVGLVAVEQPAADQAPDVGPRAGEVVGRQALVERQADRVGQQLLGRAALEPPVPERAHRLALASRLVGWACLAAQVCDAEAPEPHEALGVLVVEACRRRRRWPGRSRRGCGRCGGPTT